MSATDLFGIAARRFCLFRLKKSAFSSGNWASWALIVNAGMKRKRKDKIGLNADIKKRCQFRKLTTFFKFFSNGLEITLGLGFFNAGLNAVLIDSAKTGSRNFQSYPLFRF